MRRRFRRPPAPAWRRRHCPLSSRPTGGTAPAPRRVATSRRPRHCLPAGPIRRGAARRRGWRRRCRRKGRPARRPAKSAPAAPSSPGRIATRPCGPARPSPAHGAGGDRARPRASPRRAARRPRPTVRATMSASLSVRTIRASSAATSGVTARGLGGKKTRPTMSAPARKAARSVSGSERPQILMRCASPRKVPSMAPSLARRHAACPWLTSRSALGWHVSEVEMIPRNMLAPLAQLHAGMGIDLALAAGLVVTGQDEVGALIDLLDRLPALDRVHEPGRHPNSASAPPRWVRGSAPGRWRRPRRRCRRRSS